MTLVMWDLYQDIFVTNIFLPYIILKEYIYSSLSCINNWSLLERVKLGTNVRMPLDSASVFTSKIPLNSALAILSCISFNEIM